jgi:hypothetical protein
MFGNKRETPKKEPEILAKFLKSIKKIDDNSELDGYLLYHVKIPLIDGLYDFLVRLILISLCLAALYGMPPKLLILKAAGLSLVWLLLLKLIREIKLEVKR